MVSSGTLPRKSGETPHNTRRHSMLKSILDHNADALAALAKTEDPGARAIIADTISHAGVFDAKLPSPPPPAEPEE
ncbi:hypothetical protein OVER9000_63 [Escherichia phage vB_EcoD_Over9000]|uniref:Uncharacterized protein n=1 Tax=Escherichia phage vB_EcoD_Over9000 TaxID=2894795 RepID=A0AAE8YW09_9CAUD|nr:hypothetical protein P9626_gp63 [Escherichia phage vB_EcoD_Over9000]UGO49902.1 hypothetical protein OVER9000_63 [Escherichia phage vB_EcoD_Over9000]